MSVTVLTRVRARPGGEAALIAAAVRSCQTSAAEGAGEAPPRLFQGYDDPERFYWVTHWANRELYLAGVPSGAADGWLSAVCGDEVERSFFTPLDASAVAPEGEWVGGALITLAAPGSPAAQAAGEQLIARLGAEPARMGFALHRGADEPSQYLALYGWESESARQRFYMEALPRYEAAVRVHGGQVEAFVERTLADVDRYPREANAARPPIRAGQTPVD
jgi:heme-degrading monooxygenase HmoA